MRGRGAVVQHSPMADAAAADKTQATTDASATGGGAGTKSAEETFTAAQLEAKIAEANRNLSAKILGKLGVKNDDEAFQLVELARKTKRATDDHGTGAAGSDVEALTKKHVDAAVERLGQEHQKQLQAQQEKVAHWRTVAERHAIDNAIAYSAGKRQALNPEQVTALLRERVRISADGAAVEVVDSKGLTVYGKDGKPVGVDEFVSEWLAANAHFLPSGVKPGAGQGSSTGGGSNSKTITRAEWEALPPEDRMARHRAGFKPADN